MALAHQATAERRSTSYHPVELLASEPSTPSTCHRFDGGFASRGERQAAVTEWIVVGASLVALASPVLWVPLLQRLGTIDVPNDRSSHSLPTIRGVGVAPTSGVLVAIVLILASGQQQNLLLIVLTASVILAGLGLLEDVRGLAIRVRISGQLAVGLLVGVFLCVLVARPWWLALFVALAYSAYVNATNFMDGIDGISAMHGTIGGLHYLLVGMALDLYWLQLGGALLGAVFLAFAPWNLSRRRVFLGDVGSYLLGGLVVGCAVALWLQTSEFLLAIAPLLIYLSDTATTMLRRARRREPLTTAHRSHAYQRLTDRGLSHLTSAGAVSTATMVCCLLAWWLWFGSSQVFLIYGAILSVLAVYLWLPVLVRPVAGRQK